MLKRFIVYILKIIKRRKIKVRKKVIIDKNANFTFNSLFEGKNKINKNTTIDNSKIGFATYIGQECVFVNTKIGRYCCIANNVKTIIAIHPTTKFVSVHPAFFSTKKQARFYLCRKSKI